MMEYHTFTKTKKISKTHEYVRFLALIFLTFYSYSTFLTNANLGASDALWYQYILHDAITQLHHGIFPTYVGQSIYSAFGGPVIRAPYYLFFGQFLDVITLGKLSSLSIQHLTILASAFAAAFICYFLFVQIAPRLRWAAVVFAFFYISCPGVMGLIYKLDMYYSFMAIPYLPIVVFGLLQTQQKGDVASYLITATALACIFMSHPPIAIWTMAICLLFYGLRLIFFCKGLLGICLFVLVLIALLFWQLTSTFSLGLGKMYSGEETNYIQHVLHILRADIPNVFLPIKKDAPANNLTSYLQLGYSLWLAVFMGVTCSRVKTNYSIQYLLICVLFLLLFLYPLPYISYLLWSVVPQIVKNITLLWPMQRFYIILAALACFIGILSLKSVHHSKYKKICVLSILFLLTLWNMYQIQYFIPRDAAQKSNDNSWKKPENIHFFNIHTLQLYTFRGVYDPILKNRLLDQRQLPIANYDNEQVVVGNCASNHLANSDQINTGQPHLFPLKVMPSEHFPLILFRAKISANKHYLLCLQTSFSDTFVNFVIENQQYYSFFAVKELTAVSKKGKPIITIPIFASDKTLDDLRIQLGGVTYLKNPSILKINSYNFVHYEPSHLPIKIKSFTPYKASVITKTNHTYLEIFKEYYPGYKAEVNNQDVPVLSSKNKMVMIPLEKAGLNKIKLKYIGTPMMRISFYISMLSWIAVLSFLLGKKLNLINEYHEKFIS